MGEQRATPEGTAHVYYGGQAVIEGVMIRGPEFMGIAVRHPRGHIVHHAERLSPLYTGQARAIPLLRGVIVLWETMALGMRALTFSSKISMEAAEGEEETEFPQTIFWGAIALSVAFVIGFFFALPIVLAHVLHLWDVHHLWVVVAETVLRLGIFIGYIAAISRIPDIRRVFQYHGAEHMTIHAYEAGRPLTPESIRQFPKEHTRCGTSFLLVVVMVAMVVFFVFDASVNDGIVVRVASRILLIPFIAAVAYEILRLGGRFDGTLPVRILFAPNIALQYITTQEPDDSQVEVAVAAFEAALERVSALAPPVIAEEVGMLGQAPPLS